MLGHSVMYTVLGSVSVSRVRETDILIGTSLSKQRPCVPVRHEHNAWLKKKEKKDERIESLVCPQGRCVILCASTSSSIITHNTGGFHDFSKGVRWVRCDRRVVITGAEHNVVDEGWGAVKKGTHTNTHIAFPSSQTRYHSRYRPRLWFPGFSLS